MLYPVRLFINDPKRMAKRRLSLQQKRRIAHRQQKSREGVDGIDDKSLSPPREGLVIARYGKQVAIESFVSTESDRPHRCHIRANIVDIVTGDRVIWRAGVETGIVESVLPRTSLMARPDTTGKLKPLAANIDRIAIVFAPRPQPHQNLIDRYLVAADSLGVQPLLILNKMDLIEDCRADIEKLLDLYTSLGLNPVQISSKQGLALDGLRAELEHLTVVLVGQSGVGKSSIINRLHPQASAEVGDLSQVAKGRHTTTVSQFYHLPGGGGIIDSPGIREFGLWHMAPRDVAMGFVEFKPLLGNCKFRDCVHLDEPGCAVLEAVKTGIITTCRHDSYRQILQDLSSA
jgi:ribosome biogenesis GTPase / thiamine phosphate phosphatase